MRRETGTWTGIRPCRSTTSEARSGLGSTTRWLERTGFAPPVAPGGFTGFSHRPDQLRRELRDADLRIVELVNVEGPAALLGDLGERLADPTDAAVVYDSIRAVEHVPELLGVGPHLLAVTTPRRQDVQVSS